jgi:predicted nucleic acid-binding Zn ribbon protein
MTDDHWNGEDEDEQDEDWYDGEDDDLDEQELAPCPECGAPIELDAEKCHECGYWILETDRPAMGTDRSISGRLKLAAIVLLVVLLTFVFVGGFMML